MSHHLWLETSIGSTPGDGESRWDWRPHGTHPSPAAGLEGSAAPGQDGARPVPSWEVCALGREPPRLLVPLPASRSPVPAGWRGELISIAAIPARYYGEELRSLLGVTARCFQRVRRRDETIRELPRGAPASLLLGQGLV